MGLRKYLNSERNYAELHEPMPGERRHIPNPANFPVLPNGTPPAGPAHGDATFDDGEPDVVDDDDGLEDGSEMAIDTQPLLGPLPPLANGAHVGAPPVPPPPPQIPFPPVASHPQSASPQGLFDGQAGIPPAPPRVFMSGEADDSDFMDVSTAGPSVAGASTATLGLSGAGHTAADSGPSTASIQGQQHGTPIQGDVYPPSASNGNNGEGTGNI
jgi:F-box and leucine-rich repeat protein GRR1